MIALRPPSYHTIEDPPPYPDDDVDNCPLMGVSDKQPLRLPEGSVMATNRTSVDRPLASSSELLQLCDHEDQRLTQPAANVAVRQFRDLVGRRRNSPRQPSTNTRTCRLEDSDTSRTNDDTEQSWRYQLHHQLTFDLAPAASGASPFSPCRTTVTANTGSPRPTDRSFGVPYSVTCPSRFDGCLLNAAGQAPPLDRQVPRPSTSGEPVTSAAVRPRDDRTYRRESRQTSSVFEISSYIIANSASNASVQTCSVAVEL